MPPQDRIARAKPALEHRHAETLETVRAHACLCVDGVTTRGRLWGGFRAPASSHLGRVMATNEVSFTKKYDGTGGVSHSVTYEGAFDDSHQTIEGRGGSTGRG
jgi:hypothetical protein